MQAKWSINPDFKDLDRFIELSKQYDTAFEYIDFTYPKVYQNAAEMRKRIETYKALDRDPSKDTLHGVFLDIVVNSSDPVIRENSYKRCRQSMEVAEELGCRAVIFHTNYITGFKSFSYREKWVFDNAEFYRRLL